MPKWILSMSRAILPTSNRAVLCFLQRCMSSQNMTGPSQAFVHEFGDCRYSVSYSNEASETATISFCHPYAISTAARQYAAESYAGVADIIEPAEEQFQISLKVKYPPA